MNVLFLTLRKRKRERKILDYKVYIVKLVYTYIVLGELN